ncbi:MAG: LysR family transcriptional regulator substrate-binding protein [Deltaproteobacteria bacterium]|nr:MAG: LysR family transcriptional regulator substrate-binding protein [Deltaproteobacteria bacterium]
MSRSELRRLPALASASRDPQNLLRHRRNAKLLGRGFSELRHPVGGEPADPHARGALWPPVARANARQRAADAGRRDPLPGEQGYRPALSGPRGTSAGDELSGQLKRYLRAFPQVHLHLEYSRSNKIYEDAVRGNIDLGVVAYPIRRPQITGIPFREDRLVLVCPPGHPLSRHKNISITKLNGEPLVGYERDIPTRKETDRLLRRYGVDVRYVMELDNIETIKRVIEIGTGIAILPEPAVRSEVRSKTLSTVQLSDEVFLRPLGIIHRQGKHFSPAAEKFIEFLRAE